MQKRISTVLVLGITLAVAGLGFHVDAQRQRASPRDKVSAKVGGVSVTIEYSRPYMKGRTIFAKDGLVPFGKVWRTGADEATTLTTDGPLVIGALTVPAGAHTIYTIPNEREWTLIVNNQTGQWGTVYQESMDLGRVPMKVAKVEPTEQFQIAISETPTGGELVMTWETTKATVGLAGKK